MTKKIILTLFLFISFFWGESNWYAGLYDSSEMPNTTTFDGVTALPDTSLNIPWFDAYDPFEKTEVWEGTVLDTQESLDKRKAASDKAASDKAASDKAASDKAASDKAASDKAAEDKRKAACEKDWNCLNEKSFRIDTGKFSPIGKMTDKSWTVLKNTEEKINFLLWTIIQKLMIALWVLSVLIMTVGGGYIIMYHGQDELLSKGKSIFMSGIIALVVALSSYYIVSGLRFILYN